MALSHGSEKDNKKTANCKGSPNLFNFPTPAKLIRSSLELNQANKYLGNLLRKSYLPPQSSALSNQPLRHTVISIKDRRLDSLFPATF